MANAIRFKHVNVGRQQGEIARLKVIQGPDYGAVYVIMGPRAFLGRGEENDIVISDLKASRIHAEMTASQAGGWTIKDKGSANGILFNGNPVREAQIRLGDSFTIGETTLEFVTSDVGTAMLVAPPRSAFRAESQISSQTFGQSLPSASSGSPNRLIFLVGAAGVIFMVLFTNGDKPRGPPQKKDTSNQQQDLASYLPQQELNPTVETIFKDGFREYLAGNYNRARTQFETVLQISPGHVLATLYLENCSKQMEGLIKLHLENGKKSMKAGKLKIARSNFERVMRLLFKDQTNPAYIEAKEQVAAVEKKMKGEAGSK